MLSSVVSLTTGFCELTFIIRSYSNYTVKSRIKETTNLNLKIVKLGEHRTIDELFGVMISRETDLTCLKSFT